MHGLFGSKGKQTGSSPSPTPQRTQNAKSNPDISSRPASAPMHFLPKPSMLPSLTENLEASDDELEAQLESLNVNEIGQENSENSEDANGQDESELSALKDDSDEKFKKAASIEAVKAPVKTRREKDDDLSEEAKRNTLLNSMLYQLDNNEESVERLMLSPVMSPTTLTPTDSPLIGPMLLSPSSSVNTEISLGDISGKDSGTPTPRPSSPAHPFRKRVAFDTFTNDSSNQYETLAFTLQYKHTNYVFQRTSRTFLVGYDENESSLNALKWAVDEMLNDGDILVCLRAIPMESYNLKYKKDYKIQGNKIIEDIASFNKGDKAISIVLEFSVGKVPEMIIKAIKDYDPVSLIVGTRGIQKTGFKNLIASKSMSKYCLQYAQVPVIIINPLYEGVNIPVSSQNGMRLASALSPTLSATSTINSELQKSTDSESIRSGTLDSRPLEKTDIFKYKLASYPTYPERQVSHGDADGRSSRFRRAASPVRGERSSSGSRSRTRNFSPARALSPFKFFRKKD